MGAFFGRLAPALSASAKITNRCAPAGHCHAAKLPAQ